MVVGRTRAGIGLQARLQGTEEDLETSEQIRGLERRRADEAHEELEALREALQAAELNTHTLRRQLHDAQSRARAGEVSPPSLHAPA